MFPQARRRFTIRSLALFTVVIAAFSVAFWIVLALILQPSFDIAPDESGATAQGAYQAALARTAIALVVADAVAVVLVGAAAWLVAARTLRPIAESHERQQRFVADASHEIRTPLAAIRTTADSALARNASEDELRSALGAVSESTARLSRMTNDLLILASGERPKAPRMEAFDLSVAVAETIDAQRLALGPSGSKVAESSAPGPARLAPVAIHADLAPDVPVRGDLAEIGRIVANLIDNAVRYGGGTVWIRTAAGGREAIVEVRDNGPGIATADQRRIFEPFFRVHADETAPPGTGLGLAIAAGLAARNRGQLSVESRAGAGATFRLVLPAIR